LLHTLGGGFVRSLSFDHRNGEVSSVPQQIVNTFGGQALPSIAEDHNPPISNAFLLREGMRLVIPAGFDELRENVFSTGVGFGDHLPQWAKNRTTEKTTVKFARNGWQESTETRGESQRTSKHYFLPISIRLFLLSFTNDFSFFPSVFNIPAIRKKYSL
jgi:hypothetical protein